MDIVNEETTYFVVVSFFDEEQNPVLPNNVQYKIEDIETGQTIKEWTRIEPREGTYDIEITAEENKIIDDSNNVERKILTIKYSYGANRAGTGEYIWGVKNLKGIETIN